MKILVIGGSGLIGSKVVPRLRAFGHEAISASPSSGVDTVTGEGLDAAMAGVDAVLDLSNSPSFADKDVLAFFETTGRNIAASEAKAGVKHHIALSVVGADRLPDSGYLRAKVVQENLIRASGVPYTIVRSTQFFEFLNGIVQASANGESVPLSTGYMQPIASDEVADAMTTATVGAPANGIVEIGGPDKIRMADLVQRFLVAIKDPRRVTPDPQALYFGTVLEDDSLIPGAGAKLGTMGFDAWFAQSAFAT
ncbi:MAG TPA: SDR family oxidoreductase [Luteibacter sp.]|uniref:SDR family oxidoreductase n=1 Tax=Luteibacter sp. TaxID=1886636 RepID=UPI002BE5511D|nr:SDR family oxidoreductase [Luteibacter sp.]HVI53706.1 SDR family oxidoreductase [Luteibacter sp.]